VAQYSHFQQTLAIQGNKPDYAIFVETPQYVTNYNGKLLL
jgi:hypothetical protein